MTEENASLHALWRMSSAGKMDRVSPNFFPPILTVLAKFTLKIVVLVSYLIRWVVVDFEKIVLLLSKVGFFI